VPVIFLRDGKEVIGSPFNNRAAYPLPAVNNFDFEVHNDGALFQQRFLGGHEKPLRKCGPTNHPFSFKRIRHQSLRTIQGTIRIFGMPDAIRVLESVHAWQLTKTNRFMNIIFERACANSCSARNMGRPVNSYCAAPVGPHDFWDSVRTGIRTFNI
jgi:hypothetical protein